MRASADISASLPTACGDQQRETHHIRASRSSTAEISSKIAEVITVRGRFRTRTAKSALGQKRTSTVTLRMSALGQKRTVRSARPTPAVQSVSEGDFGGTSRSARQMCTTINFILRGSERQAGPAVNSSKVVRGSAGSLFPRSGSRSIMPVSNFSARVPRSHSAAPCLHR